MPISKERLISAIEALEAVIALFEQTSRENLEDLSLFLSERLSISSFSENLRRRSMGLEYLLLDQIALLQKEKLWWRFTSKRNESEKKRQARRRAEARGFLERVEASEADTALRAQRVLESEFPQELRKLQTLPPTSSLLEEEPTIPPSEAAIRLAAEEAFAHAPEGHRPIVDWNNSLQPSALCWQCECDGFEAFFIDEAAWETHAGLPKARGSKR